MARNRSCEYNFSGKATDVEYRTKRLIDMAVRSQNALASIDPAATDAEAHAQATVLVAELLNFVERMADARPQKRTYVKGGKPKPETAPKKRGRKPKLQEVQAQAADIDLLEDVVVGTPLVSLDSLLDAAE